MAVKYSSYSMFKRLLALIVLVTFFVCTIIARLFYLQIIDGYSITKKGLTQWLRDLPLTAIRGSITDRNGVVLASSYTSYDIYVRPADIVDLQGLTLTLSSVLEEDYDKLYEKISKHNYSEIKIKSHVSKDVVSKLLENYKEGMFFTSNIERNYSYDEMLCQILGFVSTDNSGQSGLESFYNTYLSGVDGVSLVESDLKGTTLSNSITYYENPINGLNIALTIDFKIQNEVEKILAQAMNSTAAKSISCMVTDPSTGEILSVVTLPSYNLNDVPRDDISALNKLSRAKTIVDTYEPGSTFKPIVTAIALEEGLTTKHDYFYCGGYRIINGVRIKCARRSGHGSQSLEQGLMNRCNCVFMDLISKIGLEKFYQYLENLGFTKTLGIDYPGEITAVLMPKEIVTAADLARMGFGQSIALSSLEMMVGVAAVINNGYVLEPHFVSTISKESGETVYVRNKTIKNKVFSEQTSKIMREMLYSVVDKGGGKYAKVEGYTIGGKTGTAQKYENGAIAQGKYIASFIGFAPYDQPQFLVYVTVDEPQGAYYGGVVAAPIAKQIFEKIFQIKNMGHRDEISNEKDVILPTFIGMTLTEAASLISSLGLQYLIQGDGDYVTNQIPAPTITAKEGDIVLLTF